MRSRRAGFFGQVAEARHGGHHSRVDALAKVTGTATYVADIGAAELGEPVDTALVVTSAQGSGRVISIDAGQALAVPGVRHVITRENAPRLRKITALGGGEFGDLLPLQDDRLRYNAQCIAVVVAETLEAAREAAELLRVTYSAPDEGQAFTLSQGSARLKSVKKAGIAPGRIRKGDAEAAYRQAPHRVDATFHTAPHHHNAIEPGGAVAQWHEDGTLTVHAPVQWNHAAALALGQAFGAKLADRLPGFIARVFGGLEPRGRIRVFNTFSGGAFGRNSDNLHLLLAPLAARVNGRPVRLILTRRQTFSLTPYRGEVIQRMRLGATREGRLTSLIHDVDIAKGRSGGFVEPVGEGSGKVYDCPTILVRHRVAELDLNAPGWMRAPGGTLAHFALESSMDELAHRLRIDPLELRRRNYAAKDPVSGAEWSSKSLNRCYEAAAEAIGWSSRLAGGSIEHGRIVGYGMATAMHFNNQFPASSRVRLNPDGTARVCMAVAEMGQGSLTALTRLAAEALGLGVGQVRLEWDDSRSPLGAPHFASAGTLSNGDALTRAAKAVRSELLARAVSDMASPLFGREAGDLSVEEGWIVGPGGVREPVFALMARQGADGIEKRASSGRDMGRSKLTKAAFGAQFAKVSIDRALTDIRVERLVGAFACGRIVDPPRAEGQLVSGMIWGVGQALMEESVLDPRHGRWVNANLAEALVPTHADAPRVEAILLEEDDTRAHPLGIKGVGEIGLVGTSAAIANAVFDALGVRIRSLPIRIEDLAGRPARHPHGGYTDSAGKDIQ